MEGVEGVEEGGREGETGREGERCCPVSRSMSRSMSREDRRREGSVSVGVLWGSLWTLSCYGEKEIRTRNLPFFPRIKGKKRKAKIRKYGVGYKSWKDISRY